MALADFEADVVRGEAVTGRLLKEKGMRLRFFRHPYLHCGRDLTTKASLERFLSDRGYRIAPVTIDADDYVFAAAYSRATERGDGPMKHRIDLEYVRFMERAFDYSERLSQALFGREIRQVLLLHANALNSDHFSDLARMMKKRGYRFVSLDDALADEAYASSDTHTGEESITWLDRWAITKGMKNEDNALDAFPEIPEFVAKAGGS